MSFIALACFSLFTSAYAQPAGFIDEVYISGFAQAVGATFDENSRMYVWEKGGKVWIVENGVKSAQPLLDISEEVGNWRDFGLLGFVLDPNFLTNGHMYLLYIVDRHHLIHFGTPSYSPTTDEYFNATIGRITRYTAEASTNYTTVDYSSRLVLLGETASTGLPHLHQSHGIGSLVFGTDGTLLASMGDGASYSSVDQGSASETYWSQALADGIITSAENVGAYRCQQLNSMNGKILRLDPATGDGIPSNPHYDSNDPRSPASRLWARGLRNPCRMSLDVNTGSHDPADGDPGTIYIGDVGWGAREELNVCDGPDQNFGWPYHEGIDHFPGYNNSTYIPSNHTPPKVQWRNGQTAKGVINGTVYNVGSTELPGNNFGGNCSIGGAWYNSTAFPAQYQDTYFHADYGGDWIKSFSFDASGNPTQVQDFKTGANGIVFVGIDPINGSLYWIGDAAGNSNNGANEVHRITYNPNGNLPPVAVAKADVNYGAGPLTVNFSSDFSYDPEGTSLTYAWDFGDGNNSTDANPSHTFTPSGSGPTTYTVGLTVTDGATLVGQTDLKIYANNTPPQIQSTSLDGLSTFTHDAQTNLSLSAVVTDAEHSSGQLSYSWLTSLYHNNHNHNDPPINSATGNAVLTPVGCDGVTYWYRITLTVTDPTGLSSTYVKDLQPDCSGTAQTITFAAIPDKNTYDPAFTIAPSASSNLPVSSYLIDGPATLSGNTVTLTGYPGIVTIRAVQGGNGTYTPAVAVERSFTVMDVPAPFTFEKGTLTNVGSAWQSVSLSQTFNSPVIVASVEVPGTSTLPAVTRIDNVSGNGFDIRVQNPSDVALSGYTVHYMVFDEGLYTLGAHGIKMEAVTANASITAGASNWVLESRSYQQNYTNPVVLGQVMSYNDPDWSSFWAAGASRSSAPSSGAFSAGKQVAEDSDGTRNTETIGYVVIEAGSGQINGVDYQAALGADIVQGVGDVSNTYNYALSGFGTPDVAILSTAGEDGGNGSWPVLFGATPLTAGNLQLAVDEDQIGDSERNHTTEEVAYIVFEGQIDQSISFDSIPDKLTTDPGFDVTATASSGLPVSFSVLSGPASISGSTVTLNGSTGTVTIQATQGGNSQFNAATPVSRSFEVTQQLLDQTITFDAIPDKLIDDPDFTITATASSGLAVSFAVISGPANVVGNTVSLTGSTGTVVIEATQAGNAQYNPAPPVSRSFDVTDPNGCTPVLVDSHDFESGWGLWNDGGNQCRRHPNDAPYAYSGTYCVRLRDNESSSVMTTDNLDLSSYAEVTVDFTYLVVSFEDVEDFWLQISTNGGASFTTVEEWNLGDEFNNDERKFESVVISGPFSTISQIRFRCDASGGSDFVYFDDVSIYGCGTGGGPTNQAPIAAMSATPTSGTAPLLVNFDASASLDPDGDNMTYSWDYGNGFFGTGVTSSHTYTLPGTYTASVVVSDGVLSDTASETITVTNPSGGSCTDVQIDANDFESGWGIWIDGGGDCFLDVYTYANSGSYCVLLRDDTDQSVMTTQNLDLTTYSELTVSFSYAPLSMGLPTDDFWLQISTDGGVNWLTVEEWNRGDEFENKERHNEDVLIPGPFTANTQVRFRCDATNNGDHIYIDDVVLTGCIPTTRRANPALSQPQVSDIYVYPNPVEKNNVLHVGFTLEQREEVNIRLLAIDGREITQVKQTLGASSHQLKVNVPELPSGIYLLRIDGESWQHSERILLR